MKERPILFSAPMVRAILAGSKSQTLRLLKTQPPEDCGTEVGPYHPTIIRRGEEAPGPERFGVYTMDGAWSAPCPYGAPGDRLWVRETFAKIDGQTRPWIETDYRATYTIGDRMGDMLGIKKRWAPAIHMPRHASRITLEITGVRVERLHDISPDDCVAEGAVSAIGTPRAFGTVTPQFAVACYRALWESINGAGSWDANPFVWIIEFEKGA